MRCIVGRAWASSAWHGEKSSSKQWHEGGKSNDSVGCCFCTYDLCNLSRQGMCTWHVFTLIWSPVPHQAQRLDKATHGSLSSPAQLSVTFLCRNAGRGLWMMLARLPQQLHEQHALLSILSWAYSACVLCSAVSMAWCAIMFDFTFLFQASSLFVGYFAGHFENTVVPYLRPPKLHFVNFHINYPLDLL